MSKILFSDEAAVSHGLKLRVDRSGHSAEARNEAKTESRTRRSTKIVTLYGFEYLSVHSFCLPVCLSIYVSTVSPIAALVDTTQWHHMLQRNDYSISLYFATVLYVGT